MDLSPDQRAALGKITAELADWQPLFDNAKRLRVLLADLQDLTLAIVEAGEDQEPHPAKPDKTPWARPA